MIYKTQEELEKEISKYLNERLPPKTDPIWKDNEKLIQFVKNIGKEFLVKTLPQRKLIVNIENDEETGTVHITAYPEIENIKVTLSLD